MLKGGERHPDFSYPDDVWVYYVCAERFGWTPDQVDDAPYALIQQLLAVAKLVEEVKAENLN